MDKKAKKKWNFEREDKNENQTRKQNRKKSRILKTGLSGEQNLKNLSNCRKIAFLDLFTKHKHNNTGKNKNTEKQKTDQKTASCILANNPLFLVHFCFFNLHSFMSAKLRLLKTL